MVFHLYKLVLATAIALNLAGCIDDGKNGTDGADGQLGAKGGSGANSLIVQTPLNAKNDRCFGGGLRIDSGIDANGNTSLDQDEISQTSYICQPTQLNEQMNFNRIASFPICSQLETQCNTDVETAAEIVAASDDGMTLVYTDSPAKNLGFVDISNPAKPLVKGTLALEGEPTSVAVSGQHVLVAVNQSEDFVMVAGRVNVIDMATQKSVTAIDLGGQPDSIAVSPDGKYALVVIENERDEDLGDGAPPQLPAGDVVILNIDNEDPAQWTTSNVDITGLADKFPADPEPEYVDINENNIAVITLQENNHIILIDLAKAEVMKHFSAGTVDLDMVDLSEGALKISQTESQDDVAREPDGVSWINNKYFATANEGDLEGGSRGFSVFNLDGDVVWDSGNSLDHHTARLGHYPDKRSGNKGNEPENIEMGIFGDNRYLFVNSERSSLVFVYDVADPTKPTLKQILPAGVGPEGGLAIPSRNLLVIASEEDNRGDKIRSSLNIYHYNQLPATYPTLSSVNREDGTPIPWSAMSGLSSDPVSAGILYAVEDSFYQSTRIFKIDTRTQPASLVQEIMIKDTNDVFAKFKTAGTEEDATLFDDVDLAAMINDDKTVNIDAEGIAKAPDGGFWIASEGAGTLSNTGERPLEKLNFIFKTDDYGVIENVISLPESINDLQIRFGFEGIAEDDGKAYVAFQRAWEGEANPRIGIYDVANESWSFVFYPLDAVESLNKGWVGLSDITAVGEGKFLILERDNQGGPDAAIKRLYLIDLNGVAADSVVSKTLVRDLLPTLQQPGGAVYEKVEGTALMENGDVYIINDNDGVDDNSGETQLMNLGNIL